MKQKFFSLWARVKRVPLPVLCYSVIIAGALLYASFTLAADSILRATGSLAQQTLTAQDFVLKDIDLLPGGGLRTTTDDPWMLLEDLEGTVRTLRYKAEYSAYPHEINLYYTTAPGQPYSQTRRVWPERQEDGSYRFTLPRQNIYSLRLDAASALVEMEFSEIVLNEAMPPWQYFNPGPAGAVGLAVLPVLAAAVLRWLIDMWHYWLGGKKSAAKRVRKKHGA